MSSTRGSAPAQSAAPDLKKKLHDKLHELKQKRQGYHYDWNQDTLRDVAGSEAVTVVITVDAGGKLLFAECCRSTTRFVGGEQQQVLQAAAVQQLQEVQELVLHQHKVLVVQEQMVHQVPVVPVVLV